MVNACYYILSVRDIRHSKTNSIVVASVISSSTCQHNISVLLIFEHLESVYLERSGDSSNIGPCIIRPCPTCSKTKIHNLWHQNNSYYGPPVLYLCLHIVGSLLLYLPWPHSAHALDQQLFLF